MDGGVLYMAIIIRVDVFDHHRCGSVELDAARPACRGAGRAYGLEYGFDWVRGSHRVRAGAPHGIYPGGASERRGPPCQASLAETAGTVGRGS